MALDGLDVDKNEVESGKLDACTNEVEIDKQLGVEKEVKVEGTVSGKIGMDTHTSMVTTEMKSIDSERTSLKADMSGTKGEKVNSVMALMDADQVWPKDLIPERISLDADMTCVKGLNFECTSQDGDRSVVKGLQAERISGDAHQSRVKILQSERISPDMTELIDLNSVRTSLEADMTWVNTEMPVVDIEDVALDLTVKSSTERPAEPTMGSPSTPLSGSPVPVDISTSVPVSRSRSGANVMAMDSEGGTIAIDPGAAPIQSMFSDEPMSLVERLRKNLPEGVPACPCLKWRKFSLFFYGH